MTQTDQLWDVPTGVQCFIQIYVYRCQMILQICTDTTNVSGTSLLSPPVNHSTVEGEKTKPHTHKTTIYYFTFKQQMLYTLQFLKSAEIFK